ncbi:L,D-peptidoglycan transpeptidase YkuD (ErfK/YbiS/YcfS/YnhG family) [Pseudorhizobium tarimense]|uniref:L,D-peptidoglycan transpeptidase YkuD (ErfK/YbiS/YcfS/YnhG family) n=1 Tax=Pseudorhizobium tarimense TaxID=1079109 RepID=A0ABV2H7Y7_9HYPH|nr:L,D-transpeptidase [Pseudorhizobium tarimense]MCJ8519928.1 L,D-transpeptidase [Pseudorhizobium tarimense]
MAVLCRRKAPPALVVTVQPAPGDPRRGFVSFGGLTVPAALGRSGRTVFKREGDGATPIAAMRLLYGFYRGDRALGLHTALPMRRIRKDMLWCDQPDHPSYNRLVRAPFCPSHEEMMRRDGLYDICLVLDWNVTSRRRHRGSAIFFHLIKPGYQPTAGCVAISLKDMRRLLPHLRRGTVVRVL